MSSATVAPRDPWHEFKIVGSNDSVIPLAQVNATRFHLGDVTITYTGNTGLDRYVERGKISAETLEEVRTIDQALLPTTDLASVPGPLRWFANTYGPHTPAALIHDYLIPDKGDQPRIPEVYADRYFRFMLGSVGVPFFKRFIMWAAVAMRTRFHANRVLPRVGLVAWAVASLVGLVVFAVTAPDVLWGGADILGDRTMTYFLLASAAPWVCSALWGRQWGAGITAALAAPWLLPAALVAVLGYGVYLVLERMGAVFSNVINLVRPANI